MSSDPLGQATGPNLYTYVNNNPLNWVDPLGYMSQKHKMGPEMVEPEEAGEPEPPEPEPPVPPVPPEEPTSREWWQGSGRRLTPEEEDEAARKIAEEILKWAVGEAMDYMDDVFKE